MSRKVHVLVDNESWVIPYALRIVESAHESGDESQLFAHADDLPGGEILFLIGCLGIVGPEVLDRYDLPLVVHESALPHGAGFAPVQWQILNGSDDIPVCLIKAVDEPDVGPIYLRDAISLDGTELNDEWRALQGEATVRICTRFLRLRELPTPTPQQGAPERFRRRTWSDSRIDPQRTIAEQFDLLRVVDNVRYPAFFIYRGQTYEISIRKRME